MPELDRSLPGVDLVADGLAALARGETTPPALLVAIGAPRLRALGLPVPPDRNLPPEPEIALYRALGVEHGSDAHGRYNALVRRLVSFESALEHRRAR